MVNQAGGIFRLTSGGPQQLAKAPAGGLDGVVDWEAGGGLLVSSWGGKAIYRVELSAGKDAAVTTVFGEEKGGALESPADIGFDQKRQRLLIPLFKENKLLIRPVAP